MIGTRGGTHGKDEPRTLQVRQQGELLQQPGLLPEACVCVRRNVGWMADGRAKGEKPSRGFRGVPGPHRFAEFSNARGRRTAGAVVNAGLAQVGGNACQVLDRRGDDVERFRRASGRFRRASGRGHNVDVVKEGGQAFTRLQALVGSNEGGVLAKRVQGRGQGVALLAAFALTDAPPEASHQ